MHLTTDTPSATFTGQHIMLSFPSGTETVFVAIDSTMQAQQFARSIIQASDEAFAERSKPLPQAEIIDLIKARRSRARRRA